MVIALVLGTLALAAEERGLELAVAPLVGVQSSATFGSDLMVGGTLDVGLGRVGIQLHGSGVPVRGEPADLVHFLPGQASSPLVLVSDLASMALALRLTPLAGRLTLLADVEVDAALWLALGGGVHVERVESMHWGIEGLVSAHGRTSTEPTGMAGIGVDLGLLPWLSLGLEARVWPHVHAQPMIYYPNANQILLERWYWPVTAGLTLGVHL